MEKKLQPFLPVLLGGHRGTYSLARSFFEEYGVKAVVVSRYLTGPISASRILRAVLQRDISKPERFLAVMQEIEQRFPDIKKIIIASDDVYLSCLLANRDSLPKGWIVPFPDTAICQRMANKASFYQLCEQAGVAYPKTILLGEVDASFPTEVHYPAILKAAVSSSYEALDFPGKKKVYECADERELVAHIHSIRQHGYAKELIIQEYIPGSDTRLGVLTVYFSPINQEVKLYSFANVLVDDPTPEGRGNSLALCASQEESLLEPVKNLAKLAGYSGFATIDVKYDERKGIYCFLDWNVRLGSNHYYVTASGKNVAACYGADFLGGSWEDVYFEEEELLYSLLPKQLLFDTLADSPLKRQAQTLWQTKMGHHPLWAPYDKGVRRWLYVQLSQYNFYRKLKKSPFSLPFSLCEQAEKRNWPAGQEGQ